LAPTLIPTSKWSLRSCSRPPVSLLARTSLLTCLTTLSLCERVSWMPGVVSCWLTKEPQVVSIVVLRRGSALANLELVNNLARYIESIFQLLHIVAQDNNRSEGLLRASMGVIG